MNTSPDRELETQLRQSLGATPQPDFDEWRTRHGDVVAYLNPIVTANYRRRRAIIVRVGSAAAAAIVLLAFVSVLFPRRESFARAIDAIDDAKTITWTITTYDRVTSKDGQRTWLRRMRNEMAFRAPHLYRDTRYDADGKVRSVEIVDTLSNRALHLNMKRKTATWLAEPTNQYSAGPLKPVMRILQDKPIEFVGQRELGDATANVFRWRRPNSPTVNPFNSFDHRKTVDIWIDAKTKELVRVYDPGADCFDPETAPDRDNAPEPNYSKGRLMGSMRGNIVVDAQLDPNLFSMTPPEGFEVVVEPPRPTVTEAEMIEWLGAAARFNGGVFYKNFRGFELDRYNREVATKDPARRTDVEQKLYDLVYKHIMNRNGVVLPSFANEYAVDGRFRYLGGGVRLGDAKRIVLFYKLKSTGRYRAVYGDLKVRDVQPEDLPLPLDE